MLNKLSERLNRLLVRWKEEPLIPFVLLVIAGSLWGFTEISDEIGEGDAHSLDRQILLSMREPGNPSDPIGSVKLEEMGRDLTALGGFTILTGLTVSAAGVALVMRKRRLAGIITVAVMGGMILTTFVKRGFDRPRPDLVPHGVVVTNASFPSGHAMMAAVVYLTLGLLLARIQPLRPLRLYIVALSVMITLLVGVSRVYLGVHWPTDVLAGWTLGAAWALAFWLIAIRLEQR
ncbi:phosphatase PAP2 family protein [Luteolibacter sp. SL250]|uniref:phosphatase PAP2 family protein n=1 Tax=Luteolibacter sp. SL250 TaxID=2995170 RepID=UPI00226F8F44|nr:phosphatase PAP2 family protein [Luteolibacter sp. SL250]WAC17945.1 phosphatase PAP2 family protein [Luteolibacter sp. SL250]